MIDLTDFKQCVNGYVAAIRNKVAAADDLGLPRLGLCAMEVRKIGEAAR